MAVAAPYVGDGCLGHLASRPGQAGRMHAWGVRAESVGCTDIIITGLLASDSSHSHVDLDIRSIRVDVTALSYGFVCRRAVVSLQVLAERGLEDVKDHHRYT